jgi:hypothetical protein
VGKQVQLPQLAGTGTRRKPCNSDSGQLPSRQHEVPGVGVGEQWTVFGDENKACVRGSMTSADRRVVSRGLLARHKGQKQ